MTCADSETGSIAPAWLRIPHVEPGMSVGLFGGSFDPPHAGHWLVAETALRRLGLDCLWWMVTPQNPLKHWQSQSDLARRIELSEGVARHPKIRVTAFDAAFDLRYTVDLIAFLRRRLPANRFVWVMGADNLEHFHRWKRWREIVRQVPIAIVDRPGASFARMSSVMARAYGHARLDEQDAALLAHCRPPAWVFLHGPRSSLSSTELRRSLATGGVAERENDPSS